MDNQNDDWRLQGQERYLKKRILHLTNYSDRITKTDHDHCEFCWEKFSDNISDALKIGYTTPDHYHWICEKCYTDFRDKFEWELQII